VSQRRAKANQWKPLEQKVAVKHLKITNKYIKNKDSQYINTHILIFICICTNKSNDRFFKVKQKSFKLSPGTRE